MGGLREGQAWVILDSVSWSSERAVELALRAVQENIPALAGGLEISHKVLMLAVVVIVVV